MKQRNIYNIIVCVAMLLFAHNTRAQVMYAYDDLGNRTDRWELQSAQVVQNSVNESDPVIMEEAEVQISEDLIFSNQVEENTINVYPNPTRGAVNVVFKFLPEDGKTSESTLKLVNTNNPDETYLYNINKLNSGKLYLEYQVGFRDKYIVFKRQKETGTLTSR